MRWTVIVPTYNGGRLFAHLTEHLVHLRRRYPELEVLVIDSGSRDGTPERAERAGFRLERVDPTTFGHGRTRMQAASIARGEILCFLTQDVLPCTPDWPERFAAALADRRVAGVYGRQVPRSTNAMEMFFVAMNYPPTPLRFEGHPAEHHPRPGRVLFSNAFSAVRRRVLLEIPFDAHVPVSEDQVWAYEVLARGYAIVYEPSAEALHAHRYSLRGLFQRSYRIGQALRARGIDGGATWREGLAFLGAEVAHMIHHGHVPRLPYLLVYEAVRWAGFQLGRRAGRRVPPAQPVSLSAA